MLRHNAGASAQDVPCEQGADECVAQTDPCRSHTEFPAELTGITDKDNCREVRGTEGECGQPRADGAVAQYKAVYICALLSAVHADADHHGEEDD